MDLTLKYEPPSRQVMVLLQCDFCDTRESVNTVHVDPKEIFSGMMGWSVCKSEDCRKHLAHSRALYKTLSELFSSKILGWEPGTEVTFQEI